MRFHWFGQPSAATDPSIAPTGTSEEQVRVLNAEPDPDDDIDPVSQVLRKTDVWFAYRVHELEGQAKEFAASHAAVGQPRHDLQHTAPLEVEVLLDKRGAEILQNWADRVRLKIRGAMEREMELLGAAVSDARRAIGEAMAARRSLEAKRESVDLEAHKLRVSTERHPSAVSIARHLSSRVAIALLVLLVSADFFANLPVFVELLPSNTQLASAFTDWEAQQLSNGLSAFYGVHHLGLSISTNPEPALLALSVIIFFLLLGHKVGKYLRQLVVLWPSTIMRTHSKQAMVPLILSTVGIVLTVTFLFWARATVKPLAAERLARSESKLTEINNELEQLTKSGAEIGPVLFSRQASADAERNYRRDRVDYGSTLSAVNVPILLLNVVLVIAAAVIGYATATGDFSSDEKHSEPEGLERLKGDIERCRTEAAQRRNIAHDALQRTDRTLARLRHLHDADVLKDLEAKAARISCAVPLFRTENARLRSLDVADILAFRTPFTVHRASAAELGIRIEMPPEVNDLETEARSLRQTLHRMDVGDQWPGSDVLGRFESSAEEPFFQGLEK